MILVFDMDNTLTDDFGSSVRPGIIRLLQKLRKDNHILILWTNSTRRRAEDILRDHKLRSYFKSCIFREDYDPEDEGLRKDIRQINGDLLIDDNPDEIEYVKSVGRKGFLIAPYRKGTTPDPDELTRLENEIRKSKSFFARLVRR